VGVPGKLHHCWGRQLTRRDPLLDRDTGEQGAAALLLASDQRLNSCPILAEGAGFFIELLELPAAVDGAHQVIVPIGVSNQPSDDVHLLPMIERIKANTGHRPQRLIADASYCSTAIITACEQRQLNAYISTSCQQHGQRPRPSRGRAPRDLDAWGRMVRKLRSSAAQAFYALRKTIVEPVFGQTKGALWLARFLLRGLEKVNGECGLMASTHNLLILFRATLETA
jgi:hypothetical protein